MHFMGRKNNDGYLKIKVCPKMSQRRASSKSQKQTATHTTQKERYSNVKKKVEHASAERKK